MIQNICSPLLSKLSCSILLFDLSFLYLAKILSPYFVLCFHCWVTQIIENDTLAPYHLFCILFSYTPLHLYLTHVCCTCAGNQDVLLWTLITLCKWYFLISKDSYLEVGWLVPRANACGVWLDISTPSHTGAVPFFTPSGVRDVRVFPWLCQRSMLLNFWHFRVDYLKCCLSLPFFLPRSRICRLH